ncbi:carboxypeptidase A4-like [Paramacrobiotus metropolitanus]|uniref:carboxypeptidase A4-like n=1 Tax=Paramacrobiotus metropolitanus TaxID=2943436 RepID=UPI0024461F66|nr:carboxypeptidase A4-like [Paramacrobiotus metropolitanus]
MTFYNLLCAIWNVALLLNGMPVLSAQSTIVFDPADKADGVVRIADPQSSIIDFGEINSYDSIVQWLSALPNEFEYVRLHKIGTTVEKRDLIAMEIDKDLITCKMQQNKTEVNNSSRPSDGKQVVFLDAGTHAREQITVTVALAAIQKICLAIRNGESNLMTKVKWFIIPLVNPDGYEYSRTAPKGKMWRKNRSHVDANCVGVDVNRNWDSQWGVNPTEKVAATEKPSSSLSLSWLYDSLFNPRNTIRQLSLLNPCSELFAGAHPFSEVESSSLSKFIITRNNSGSSLQGYISLHSMNKDQMLLFPYGFTTKRSPDYAKLRSLAGNMSDAMFSATGRRYQYGSISEIMYQTTGVQADWLYSVAGVKRNFVLELRDDFRKPPSVLIPKAFQEVYAALNVLVQDVLKSS